MAFFEGSVVTAVLAAMGIAPGRRMMPAHMIVGHIVDVGPVRQIAPPVLPCRDASDGHVRVTDLSVRPVEAPKKLASTRAFVKWWRTLPDVPAEVSQRYLCALYAEYCEHDHVVQLSDRQLVNKIKGHGVEAFRRPAKIVNGKHHRPTAYKLKRRAS